jgi:cytidine deaminase
MDLPNDIIDNLKREAKKNVINAIAPYSNFYVSSSVLTKDNKIFTGVNIENSTYNLGICAERVAIFKALSEGNKNIQAIAIYSSSDILIVPCGACRQIIYEFLIDDGVIISFNDKNTKLYKIQDLLPNAFSDKFLEQKKD